MIKRPENEEEAKSMQDDFIERVRQASYSSAKAAIGDGIDEISKAYAGGLDRYHNVVIRWRNGQHAAILLLMLACVLYFALSAFSSYRTAQKINTLEIQMQERADSIHSLSMRLGEYMERVRSMENKASN